MTSKKKCYIPTSSLLDFLDNVTVKKIYSFSQPQSAQQSNQSFAGKFFYLFLFSVNLTEYVAMDPGCLSVCLSVCLCAISTAKTDGLILMKLSTNHFQQICEVRFSPILKIQIDDVMAAIIAVFECGTLTVAILLRFSSNFRTCQ